jgi:hypothetical protein
MSLKGTKTEENLKKLLLAKVKLTEDIFISHKKLTLKVTTM